MTAWTRRASVDLTVALVAEDGHRLPLVGDERLAAVKTMCARQVPVDVMAHRLCMNADRLRSWACHYGIQLPRTTPTGEWSELRHLFDAGAKTTRARAAA